MPLLDVQGLNVSYQTSTKIVYAVRDVSLKLNESEFLGIAGESGCGKSTLLMALSRLLEPPGRITSGRIIFNGVDITQMSEDELKAIRWKEFSVVFQASMNVLNPVMKIKDHFRLLFFNHGLKDDYLERAKSLLELVQVSADFLEAYPHQLSGGMRQRIAIALSLALHPKLVFMDEPTTALDVVVQRKILQRVDALRRDLNLAIVFITHDLSLLVEIADRIIIMYAGFVVEDGPAEEIFLNPLHPYTKGLINSFPPLSGPRKRMYGIPGKPPALDKEFTGCPFFERCSERIETLCATTMPPYVSVASNHTVRCHLYKPSK